MAIGKESTLLEKKLGYKFSDLALLDLALTHSSFTNEKRIKGINAPSNERLEFLGDAVLQIVISEYLYDSFRKFREGALTRMRQRLVCEKTLSRIAEGLELGDYLNVGNGEESTDCRRRPKVLADALEALIAAVYLDSNTSGSDEYKKVILSLFSDEVISESSKQKSDYKTVLQQLIEQDGAATLEYRVLSEDGPDHKKIFKVACYVNNNEVGKGEAATKKEAEMLAAKMALLLFGVPV